MWEMKRERKVFFLLLLLLNHANKVNDLHPPEPLSPGYLYINGEEAMSSRVIDACFVI